MDTYSQIAHLIKTFTQPLLIVCGFILNMISFIVMKRIKTSSGTAKYMAFLALIDSGVLIMGGLSQLTETNFYNSIPMLSLIGCKLIPFLLYSLSDLSVLIIVMMTAERFYGVWRPLEANKLSKTKTIRWSLLVGCLFCFFINCHFIFTHSLVVHKSDENNLEENKSETKQDYVCEYIIWKEL